MFKMKISIITKFPEETFNLIYNVIKNKGIMFDNSANYNSHNNCRIINLELVNDKFIITPSKIKFETSGEDFIKELKLLRKTHNLVDYSYIESKDFSKDMNLYDEDFVKKEHKNKIENHLIWKLETGTNIFHKENETSFSIMEYIKKNDSIEILKFALNHYEVKKQFPQNLDNISFDNINNPLCFEYVESLKKDIEIENDFEI